MNSHYKAYLTEELAFTELGLQRCLRFRQRLANFSDHVGGSTVVVLQEIDVDGNGENLPQVVTEVFVDGVIPRGKFDLDGIKLKAERFGTIELNWKQSDALRVETFRGHLVFDGGCGTPQVGPPTMDGILRFTGRGFFITASGSVVISLTNHTQYQMYCKSLDDLIAEITSTVCKLKQELPEPSRQSPQIRPALDLQSILELGWNLFP